MRIVLTLLFFLSACNYRYPVDERLPKVYNQGKAMLYTEGLIDDAYGVELGNLFERANILWVTEDQCYWRDSPGIEYKGQCVAGVTFSCGEIYVAIDWPESDDPGDARTANTALLHEFGHCARLSLGWDADGDHKDADFWALIVEGQAYSVQRDW